MDYWGMIGILGNLMKLMDILGNILMGYLLGIMGISLEYDGIFHRILWIKTEILQAYNVDIMGTSSIKGNIMGYIQYIWVNYNNSLT